MVKEPSALDEGSTSAHTELTSVDPDELQK